MPRVQISKKHTLGLDEAKTKIRELVEDTLGQYRRHIDEVNWAADGCSARVKGGLFRGTFEVDEGTVAVDLDFSFLATPWMGKIRSRVEERMTEGFG